MKLTKNKEGKPMQMTKKKVFSAALAICLIAICSMGTLAWFSAEDAVTNEFMVAGSESGDPEDIFSVDVWEDLDKDGVKDEETIPFENILPGDDLEKVVHVENTGSYDQYIRVKITVTDAAIWQDVYDADMVPVTEFVDIDLDKLYGVGSYLEGDNFVYYLYYNDILSYEDGNDLVVFENVHIAERLTKEQAAMLADGKFEITVKADAVQTENVTPNGIEDDNVYEAFNMVEMVDATKNGVNTVWVGTLDELLAVFANGGYAVMTDNVFFPFNTVEIATDVSVNLYTDNYVLGTENNTDEFRNAMYVNGDLTIGGHGTISMPGAQGIKVENGMLSIYGGTFVDEEDRPKRYTETLINVYGNGILNVFGGVFNGTDYCVRDHAAEGETNIWGGIFTVSTDKGVAIQYWEN